MSWFAPRCPLPLGEKVWLERRFQWLADEFGIHTLRQQPMLIPEEANFAEPFQPTPEWAESVAKQIATSWNLKQQETPVKVFSDQEQDQFQEADPLKVEDWYVRLYEPCLGFPEAAVAGVARDLARLHLVQHKRIGTDDREFESTADLLPTFMGWGILMANAVLFENQVSTGTAWQWDMRRFGILPARMHGYALAMWAWARNETTASWDNHLRSDAQVAMRKGLRFLQKTKDSIFQPHGRQFGESSQRIDFNGQVFRLGTPTQKLACLWMLAEESELPASASEAIQSCLQDRNVDMRAGALRAVARMRVSESEVLEQVVQALGDSAEDVRIEAIYTLVQQGHDTRAIQELGHALEDESRVVAYHAACAVNDYGHPIEQLGPALMRALKRAVVDCDEQRIEVLRAALEKQPFDLDHLLVETLGPHDDELLLQMRAVLHGDDDAADRETRVVQERPAVEPSSESPLPPGDELQW